MCCPVTGYLQAVWLEIFGPVFLGFRPKIDLGTRPAPPRRSPARGEPPQHSGGGEGGDRRGPGPPTKPRPHPRTPGRARRPGEEAGHAGGTGPQPKAPTPATATPGGNPTTGTHQGEDEGGQTGQGGHRNTSPAVGHCSFRPPAQTPSPPPRWTTNHSFMRSRCPGGVEQQYRLLAVRSAVDGFKSHTRPSGVSK